MFNKTKESFHSLVGGTQRTYQDLSNAKDLPSVIDKLLDMPSQRIDRKLIRLVENSPGTTVSQLAKELTKSYVKKCARFSAGIGTAAVVPFYGTGVALGLTVAELGAFYALTTEYVLKICRLHGIKLEDKERRRALVTSALLGEEGAELISGELGLSTLSWAKNNLQNLSSPTISQVNRLLAKYVAKKSASAGIKKVAGRLIPLGIGAAIGYYSGRKTSSQVARGLEVALGPIRELTTADFLVELSPTIEIKAGVADE